MKKILFKNGDVLDISEREFIAVQRGWKNHEPTYIVRLQMSIGPFEISMIVPVDHQVEYGMPFKLYNESRTGLEDGRYFIDGDSIVKFSPTTGKIVRGGKAELIDRLFPEDDYVDKLSEASRSTFPNNLLTGGANLLGDGK